jgi:aspartyl-tRNA synthetase
MNRYRTHSCGELRGTDVGTTVRLAGWLAARRDHGQILFVHLRDFYGATQVVVPVGAATAAGDGEAPGTDEDLATRIRGLHLESVISVTGTVRARPGGQENTDIATGGIEVLATEIEVLSAMVEPPPFLPEKGAEVGDETRLRYRYIDLRRPRMAAMIADRDRLATIVRDVFHERRFVEIPTPVLSNSSPEGARDFLVPSRLHRGQFYALPQAPQQWKQLLMASGVDRYFQIAPCFRDEAARADRTPGEFYQVDIEMAFVEQEDVLEEIEGATQDIVERFNGTRPTGPFPRLTYHDAIERYGSDKPDIRFGLEFSTLTELFRSTGPEFLRDAVGRGEAVRGFVVPDGARFTRKELDGLRALAQESGVTGLAWLSWAGDPAGDSATVRGSIANALSAPEAASVAAAVGAADGSLLLLSAGPRERIDTALSAIRLEIGNRLGLRPAGSLAFVWIVDFPMFERDEETGQIGFSHNPFSMPQGGLDALEKLDPLDVRGWQYDLVCNGTELSSGAIRNNDPETLYRAFEIAGSSRSTVDEQFGHMVDAFRNGCPPHGGIAPGLERMLMLLTDTKSIREVIPFPKNQKAQDLLVGSPSPADPKLLRELGITIKPLPKA